LYAKGKWKILFLFRGFSLNNFSPKFKQGKNLVQASTSSNRRQLIPTVGDKAIVIAIAGGWSGAGGPAWGVGGEGLEGMGAWGRRVKGIIVTILLRVPYDDYAGMLKLAWTCGYV
jgi:hypothetical protein